jgi:hypothetical protein
VNQKERIELVSNKLSSIETILNELNKIAESDGNITTEEMNLLNTINYNFENFRKVIETALEDGILSDQEMESLHSYEKMIVHSASSEVFKDGVISKDERNLLFSLIKYFEEIQEIENQ